MASSDRPIPRASLLALRSGKAVLVQLPSRVMVAFEGQQVPELAEALRRAERVAEPPEQGHAVVEQAPRVIDIARVSRSAGEITQRVGHGTDGSRPSSGYKRLLEALSVRGARTAAVPVRATGSSTDSS